MWCCLNRTSTRARDKMRTRCRQDAESNFVNPQPVRNLSAYSWTCPQPVRNLSLSLPDCFLGHSCSQYKGNNDPYTCPRTECRNDIICFHNLSWSCPRSSGRPPLPASTWRRHLKNHSCTHEFGLCTFALWRWHKSCAMAVENARICTKRVNQLALRKYAYVSWCDVMTSMAYTCPNQVSLPVHVSPCLLEKPIKPCKSKAI